MGSADGAAHRRDSGEGPAMTARRKLPIIIAIAIMMLPAVHAQSPTTDGVEAYLRGDFARAAQILAPLTELTPTGDQVAAFFMAVMYDNGQGVAADPIRACALYMRASSNLQTVLGR